MVLSCGSFLTLQDHTIYFVHQSAKDYLLARPSDNALHVAHDTALNKIFPSGTNHVHYEIFRRSLKTMSATLRRDIYDLREPGIEIDDVEVPDPDPLASVGYSCLHWVDHWCDSLPDTSTSQHNDLPGRDAILAFLQTKLLHWLEAVSLLRIAWQGEYALQNLDERLVISLHDVQIRVPGRLTDLVRAAADFLDLFPLSTLPLQVYVALVYGATSGLLKELFEAQLPAWLVMLPNVEAESPPCIQTLDLSNNDVTFTVDAAAFSPDGRHLALHSTGSGIRIWDTVTGLCTQTLGGEYRWVLLLLVFSADGKQLASVLYKKEDLRSATAGNNIPVEVRIWDASTGECVRTLMRIEHRSHITELECSDPFRSFCSLAFSPNVKRLAWGRGLTIQIQDVATGEMTQLFEGHFAPVMSVAFSPDGRLLSSGPDATVRLWDTVTEKWMQTLKGHRSCVSVVSFSPNSKCLASGSWDATVRIWNTTTYECTHLFELEIGFRPLVFPLVVFSPDGKTLALKETDRNYISIWDAATSSYMWTVTGNELPGSEAFSPDGRRLTSVSSSAAVRSWDVTSSKQTPTLDRRPKPIGWLAVSRDGKYLALSDARSHYDNAPLGNTSIDIFDVTTRKYLKTVKTQWPSDKLQKIRSLTFSFNDTGTCLHTKHSEGDVECDVELGLPPADSNVSKTECYYVQNGWIRTQDQNLILLPPTHAASDGKPRAGAICALGGPTLAFTAHLSRDVMVVNFRGEGPYNI
ncbi:WD40-repeat-containing domain protein [Diplogelasinospora grovesii]|uniref:WD40-repeat-containing domain protein n=1 Tax=Diplogelasinospora grovesii TaxID=303347 RepID=A0AAN6S182_9PEZI|nr:WD40-repeat-containing domain protein [Diplogelasinospora grovesii]